MTDFGPRLGCKASAIFRLGVDKAELGRLVGGAREGERGERFVLGFLIHSIVYSLGLDYATGICADAASIYIL